jgi:hypothetical protein
VKARGFVAGIVTACGVAALGVFGYVLGTASGLYFLDPAADRTEMAAVAVGVVAVFGFVGGLAGLWGATRGRRSAGVWAGLAGGCVPALLPALESVSALAEGDGYTVAMLVPAVVLGPMACAAGGWVGASRGSADRITPEVRHDPDHTRRPQ